MPIEYRPNESILCSDVQTLVCPVNCDGVMATGLALGFSKTYHGLLYHYRKACERGEINLNKGIPSFWVHKVYNDQHQILCLPTLEHYNDTPAKLTIFRGMERLAKNYRRYGVKELGIPMIGCDGEEGFLWDDIHHGIVEALRTLPIRVVLFGLPPGEIK